MEIDDLFPDDESWVIQIDDQQTGQRMRAILPHDDSLPGYILTDIDDAGELRPDAKIDRILSPDEVQEFRRMYRSALEEILANRKNNGGDDE